MLVKKNEMVGVDWETIIIKLRTRTSHEIRGF